MIVDVAIEQKSIGGRELYQDVSFSVAKSQKIGLIGRNGSGKTTLFNILTGQDQEYVGAVHFRKGLVVAAAQQEHTSQRNVPVMEYILLGLPEYRHLRHIIDTYPETMNGNARRIQTYADALERFGVLGYYEVEDQVRQLMATYQLPDRVADATIGSLSGGQKRLIELVKVQRAQADLVLLDEPTNHMDYVAKEAFMEWLTSSNSAVMVISHDRDILQLVDSIIELRDGVAETSKGNYDAYLKNNAIKISSGVNQYTVTQRKAQNTKADIVRYQRLKEKSRHQGTIKRFKNLEAKSRTELERLQNVERPTFWIDRESVQQLRTETEMMYQAHKAPNIRMRTKESTVGAKTLIRIEDLSLGYETPLFEALSIRVNEGDRLRIHGRNGAGKSTLANAIVSTAASRPLACTKFAGSIMVDSALRIGVYEQEFSADLLGLSLADAIQVVHERQGHTCTKQQVFSLMKDYLFDVAEDAKKPLKVLSGGQKARLQLISMLVGDPNVLLLDEPTNHLDLPSIEELEATLQRYTGAIVYISHDGYFSKNIAGDSVTLGML